MKTQSLPEVDYTVTFTGGPEGRWTVLSCACEEELNGGCNAVLDLATDDAAAELSDFLGSTCELALTRGDGPTHYMYGVVSRVDLVGRVDHRLVLRVHLTSAFELGKQPRHSRIWQDVSPLEVVAEVLDEVLGVYDRTYEVDALHRGNEPRSYCVQYRETDFDFVRRLLEEEGISYYFAHDPEVGHELLRLCDENPQYRATENVDGSSVFPLIATNPDRAEVESLQGVEWSQQLTTTAILRRDYDWQHPRDWLTATREGADLRGHVRRAYAHLERRFERDDLSVRAEDLAHALALAGSVARGRSNIVGLRPGCRFATDAHSGDGAPDEYIVTHVRHRGGDAKAGSIGGVDAVVYSNEFECVPAERAIRPLPVTPKPDVRGAQTATVVGDEEIHTDEHGRVQVQFHWEETPSHAAGASCWVRCAQSWAGPGWGAQFIPRVGMEVVVEFLEGNPDRPLVIGCVYNGDNTPPFSLPGSSTKSGWRSNSSPGGGGGNELHFEDSCGSEEIYMRGQKDWRVEVNNDTFRSTGNDESHAVGHDLSKSVSNCQTESIGGSKTIRVGSNHTETIGAKMSLTVGAEQTVSVGANQAITVKGNLAETVGNSVVQTVAATKSTTVGGMNVIIVGGAMNTSVIGALTQEVGGKKVTVSGASTEDVLGERIVNSKTARQSTKKELELAVGTVFTVNAEAQIGLTSGGSMNAEAKKIVVKAKDELVVECGASSITLKKNGHIQIEGTQVGITGLEMVTIKGAKILEN
ncbi:MAG: type VI secretion system tip protein TssI/VgrG [Enhygromyxa sp.]